MTLSSLERLCEQATKGPWFLQLIDEERPQDGYYVGMAWKDFNDLSVMTKHDGDFIIAAREWLPKLIAVAKAAEKWSEQFGASQGDPLDAVMNENRLLAALAALEPPKGDPE